MSQKTLIILVVICGVLAYFGLQEPNKKRGSSVISNTSPFKSLKVNDIDQIKLMQGDSSLNLERMDNVWWAKDGELSFPVDFSKLKSLLLSVRNIKLIDRKATSQKYDEKFGLAEDSKPLKIELLAKQKSLAHLQLGNVRKGKAKGGGSFSFPSDEGHYMKINSEKSVFLSKDKVEAELRSSFWMKKELASVQKDEISTIKYEFPYKSFQLTKGIEKIEKSTDGSIPPEEKTVWSVAGDLPVNPVIKQDQMNSLLGNLEKIEVSEPVAAKVREQFKDGKVYRVDVLRGDTSLYAIKVVALNKKWYVSLKGSSDQIFEMSSYEVENVFAITKDIFNLGKVASFDNLTQVRWTGNESLQLSKSDGEWSIEGTSPKPELDGDKLKDFVKALKESEFLDYQLNNVVETQGAMLRLKTSSGKEIVIEEVGSIPLESCKLIKIGHQKNYFAIAEGVFDRIFLKQKDILNLDVTPSSSSDISTLDMSGFQLNQKDGDWTFDNGEKVDGGQIDTWFTSYESVFESPYTLTSKSFKAEHTIEIDVKDDKKYQLKIGKADKGFAPVQFSKFGGVFTVDWNVCKSLFKEKSYFKDSKKEEESKNN